MAKATVTFRQHYGYDVKAASDEHTVKDFGPSTTIQSMAEDADINVIMHRFGITGKFPENPRIPQYVDLLDTPLDFRTALEQVNQAQEIFMEYPAKFRARFENDPQQFMEWAHNPANQDEMKSLGMLKEPKPEPKPLRVEVMNRDDIGPSTGPGKAPGGPGGQTGKGPGGDPGATGGGPGAPKGGA